MDSLYKEELMELYKNPPRKGNLAKPSAQASKKNPMCGDDISLDLKIVDGVIKDAKFSGSACSVSVISSSVLLDFLIGKTITEAQKISKEDLLTMLNLNLSTSRVACATLILETLKEAIKAYEQK